MTRRKRKGQEKRGPPALGGENVDGTTTPKNLKWKLRALRCSTNKRGHDPAKGVGAPQPHLRNLGGAFKKGTATAMPNHRKGTSRGELDKGDRDLPLLAARGKLAPADRRKKRRRSDEFLDNQGTYPFQTIPRKSEMVSTSSREKNNRRAEKKRMVAAK